MPQKQNSNLEEFSEESDFEELPGKDLKVVSEKPITKLQKPMKGTWIVKLDKLNECRICKSFFLNSRDLIVHQKEHDKVENVVQSTSEKRNKFRCDFCKETFLNVTLLKEHIKTLHMKDFYEDCVYCLMWIVAL